MTIPSIVPREGPTELKPLLLGENVKLVCVEGIGLTLRGGVLYVHVKDMALPTLEGAQGYDVCIDPSTLPLTVNPEFVDNVRVDNHEETVDTVVQKMEEECIIPPPREFADFQQGLSLEEESIKLDNQLGTQTIKKGILEKEVARRYDNKIHQPNRYRYKSIKRDPNHINADPDNPVYQREEFLEKQKINFLWFFTRKQTPKYCNFVDADLVNYLRFHCFCQPRTMALIQTLKLKAIRYMAEFDMPDHTMGEIYAIITRSVTAALLPTPEEEGLKQAIKDSSNVYEAMQPFFLKGQYQGGWCRPFKTLA